MTVEDEGAGPSGPLHFKAEGRGRGRGASLFMIQIYHVILGMGPAGADVEWIYLALEDDPSFRTDTAAWWEALPSRSKDTTNGTSNVVSFDLAEVGRKRIRQTVDSMLRSGYLGHVPGEPGCYSVEDALKGYRPKFRRQNPYGWYPIDVTAARAASERQRDLMVFLERAQAELAKDRPRAARLRAFLAEAVRLLEPRQDSTP